MGSKRPIKSFKVAKTCICKNPKKHLVFNCFWGSKAVQDSLGRPKKAPKRRLKSSKGFKKEDPQMQQILAIFWTTVGALLELILRPKSASEGDQKWDHFWNRLAPPLRGPGVAFSGIIREVCKGYWDWNYTLQKNGRDIKKALKDSYRHPPGRHSHM